MKKKRLLALFLALTMVMPTIGVSAAETEPTQIPMEISVEDVIDEPIVDEPVVDEPAADELIISEPLAEKPVIEEIIEETTTEKLIEDEPEEDSDELSLFNTTKGIDIWDGTLAKSCSSGKGTQNNPYIIKTPEEFCYALNAKEKNLYYKLANDIYLNDPAAFTKTNGKVTGVIDGAVLNDFDLYARLWSSLDGNGHTIYGLYTTNNYMLYSIEAGNTMKDLHFKDFYVASNNLNGIIMENCGTITNCSFDGYLRSSTSAGFIDRNEAGARIENCTFAGTIQTSGSAGSCVYNYGTIKNCHSSTKVTGESNAGGIAAENESNGNISLCTNSGGITTDGNFSGGICGSNSGTISGCSNSGTITGTEYVNAGGVVGATMMYDTAYVIGCYNTGDVSCEDEAGGVIGYMYTSGTVAYCYNLGSAENGIAGEKSSSAALIDCRYDASICPDSNAYGTASTEEEMQSSEYIDAHNDYVDNSSLENLVYWKADTENVNNGYPIPAGEDDLYHVDIVIKGKGSTVPAEDFGVLIGRSKSITLIPEYGQIIESILINDVAQPVSDTITVSSEKSGTVTVEITFASDGTVAESFGGGSGKENDPYLISSTAEFLYLSQYVQEGNSTENMYFKLTNDITFNPATCFTTEANGKITGPSATNPPKETLPVRGAQFRGNFDGGGHTISGMYINEEGGDVGLFGDVVSGTIKNLTVKNGYVSAGDSSAGAIAGSSSGKITNCHNDNVTVRGGGGYTGGIAGWASNTTFLNCTNNADVFGTYADVGGIAGYASTIQNCSNSGNVTGSGDIVGGIAGSAYNYINCVSSGSVNGANNVGGICGRSTSGTNIVNCISSATINGRGGGILGGFSGDITLTNCVFTGSATEAYTANVYGIAPSTNYYNYKVQNCYYNNSSLTDEKGILFTSADVTDTELLSTLNLYVHTCEDYDLLYWKKDTSNLPAFSSADTYYVISFLPPSGGTLNYTGKLCLPAGSNLEIVASPAEGNSVHSVLANNTAVSTADCYTITNLQADLIIEVLFADASDSVLGAFAEGSGTKEDPYLLSTAEDLKTLSQQVNGGKDFASTYFRLKNDIVLNPDATFSADSNGVTTVIGTDMISWTPIGTVQIPFQGDFDGNDYSILGLYINDSIPYAGLFGHTGSDAYIHDLNMGYGSVLTTGNYAAPIAGSNAGIIENCTNSGTAVYKAKNIGGIAAYNTGSILSCQNIANLNSNNSDSYVGGIVSHNMGGTISHCSNKGMLINGDMGGICYLLQDGKIEFCSNSGNILRGVYEAAAGICCFSRSENGITSYINDCQNSGDIRVNASYVDGYSAGIAYNAYDAIIQRCINYGDIYGRTAAGIAITVFESYDTEAGCYNCVNYGTVTGTWGGTGGILSSAYAPCSDCINHGTVIGEDVTGGVVAELTADYLLVNCGNTGSVTGEDEVGGVVGKSRKNISNCFNTGNVTGTGNVGGLVGLIEDNSAPLLYNCYSSGAVSGDTANTTGALVGNLEKFASVSNCWYNSDKCQLSPVGTADGTVSNVSGKTSAEMAQDTFTILLNQGKQENITFSPWRMNSTLQSPAFAEFKANSLEAPVYICATGSGQKYTLKATSDDSDISCLVAVYNSNGKMTAVKSITVNGSPAEITVPGGQIWKVFAHKDGSPVISELN